MEIVLCELIPGAVSNQGRARVEVDKMLSILQHQQTESESWSPVECTFTFKSNEYEIELIAPSALGI